MPAEALPLFAAASVGRLANLFPRWLNSVIGRGSDLTGPRAMLLWILSRSDSPTMGQVAGMLDLTPRAITRLADGLERDGLVKRTPNAEDRRVVTLNLTAAGRRQFHAIEALLGPEFGDLFSSLSRTEILALISVVETLSDKMKRALDGA